MTVKHTSHVTHPLCSYWVALPHQMSRLWYVGSVSGYPLSLSPSPLPPHGARGWGRRRGKHGGDQHQASLRPYLDADSPRRKQIFAQDYNCEKKKNTKEAEKFTLVPRLSSNEKLSRAGERVTGSVTLPYHPSFLMEVF